jgi:hypothetical protein
MMSLLKGAAAGKKRKADQLHGEMIRDQVRMLLYARISSVF